jgi:hypothetical protein
MGGFFLAPGVPFFLREMGLTPHPNERFFMALKKISQLRTFFKSIKDVHLGEG